MLNAKGRGLHYNEPYMSDMKTTRLTEMVKAAG
jgi:hypothetical protein